MKSQANGQLETVLMISEIYKLTLFIPTLMWSEVATPLLCYWPKLELTRKRKMQRHHQILRKTQRTIIYTCILENEVEIQTTEII